MGLPTITYSTRALTCCLRYGRGVQKAVQISTQLTALGHPARPTDGRRIGDVGDVAQSGRLGLGHANIRTLNMFTFR